MAKTWHPCVLRVAAIVSAETGNRVEEKNLSTIETRLRSRMLRLGIADFDGYNAHLTAHEAEEREVLKGLMTTHHTFFFREFQHFDVLQETITQRVRSGEWKPGMVVKVWSAASSRGQEAYSLAMFLHVHLKKAHNIDFRIWASDIDAESVRYGGNGVYPIKEVQSIPMAYLGEHWARGSGDIAHFAKAKIALTERIEWHQENLLDTKNFRAKHGPFDVIFCRNVFIYFEDQKILSISRDLMSSLKEGGLFVTGLSEPIPAESLGLLRVGPSSYRPPSKEKVSAPAVAPRSPVIEAPRALRALVVDDSPTIQKLLKKILGEGGSFSHVDLASHGEEAQKALLAGQYDLITLDIHMPVMDGIQFLETVYKADRHPPVLVVSSVSREDRSLATRALELGARDYVEKPDLARMKESAGEILSKARTLARLPRTQNSLDLDRSFSRELRIPEPSRKMRVVEVSSGSKAVDVAALASALELESESPPTLWLVSSSADLRHCEELIKKHSKRPLVELRRGSSFFANSHYLVTVGEFIGLVHYRVLPQGESLSALLGSCHSAVVSGLQSLAVGYVLAGETCEMSALRNLGWVDQAPATSYASLSAEVFAGLRIQPKDKVA